VAAAVLALTASLAASLCFAGGRAGGSITAALFLKVRCSCIFSHPGAFSQQQVVAFFANAVVSAAWHDACADHNTVPSAAVDAQLL
jgi:hypothetical protein